MDFQGLIPPGTKLGSILFDKQRSADSTGELYEATIEPSRMRVLVRVLNAELSAGGPEFDKLQAELSRFAGCKNPHLAQMITMDQTAKIKRWLLVTSYGNANTLAERAQQKNLTAPAVVMIMKQAIAAMHYSHENKFVHGNLNLENIALTLDGKVKILNYAFAGMSLEDRKANRDFQALELINGGEPNPSTDVFALGMVFQKLFQAVGVASIPVEIRRVAERMSTQDSAARFLSMAEPQKMLGTGKNENDLEDAKQQITRTFERTRTIQLTVDREVREATIREKMPKPFTIAIFAAIAVFAYVKIYPMVRGKNLAESSKTLITQAVDAGKKVTGVSRAMDAKKAAEEMKGAVAEHEARKLSSADAAADGDTIVEPPPAAPAKQEQPPQAVPASALD